WCEYDTDLFDGPTITRLHGHYERILEGIVADPSRRIGDLPLLTERERHQVLVEWNGTHADYPRDKCLHPLIDEHAVQTQDAIAVIGAGRQLTYRELAERANQLARHLLRAGVGPEACIGVCLERSPELIVALLAALKSGGAYLPLDPSYPKERLAAILHDARTPVLLTTRDLGGKVTMDGLRLTCLDTDWEQISREPAETPETRVELDHLAYVIYTSGSTG